VVQVVEVIMQQVALELVVIVTHTIMKLLVVVVLQKLL